MSQRLPFYGCAVYRAAVVVRIDRRIREWVPDEYPGGATLSAHAGRRWPDRVPLDTAEGELIAAARESWILERVEAGQSGCRCGCGGNLYCNATGERVASPRRVLWRKPESVRGVAREWTRASRRSLMFKLLNTSKRFASAITLTYPGVAGSSKERPQTADENRALVARAKRDLNRWLTALRDDLGGYVWVQEFQSRGAVHFHVLTERAVPAPRVRLLWLLAAGAARRLSYAETRRWWLSWKSAKDSAARRALSRGLLLSRSPGGGLRGLVIASPVSSGVARFGSRVQLLRDSDAVARAYCFSYAGKAAQKALPDGVAAAGRFWGSSRDVVAEIVDELVTSTDQASDTDRVAAQALRVVRRYVSRACGFKYRGGVVFSWGKLAASKVAAVLSQARAFFARDERGWCDWVGTSGALS